MMPMKLIRCCKTARTVTLLVTIPARDTGKSIESTKLKRKRIVRVRIWAMNTMTSGQNRSERHRNIGGGNNERCE